MPNSAALYFDITLAARVRDAATRWRTSVAERLEWQINHEVLGGLRADTATALEEAREEFDRIHHEFDLLTDEITLPPFELPQHRIDWDTVV
jgi:hypothetical protein